MTIRLLWVAFLAVTLAACNGSADENNMSQEEQFTLIRDTEKELYASKDNFDKAKALLLIRKYDEYATAFPEDENAGEFLFRAGDLATGMNKSQEAVAFFDRVYNDYKDYEKAPDALFLKAFVLEDQVKDLAAAEKAYKEFIKNHPDHPLVGSAEFSLANLGTPTEELLKKFEEANAAANPAN